MKFIKQTLFAALITGCCLLSAEEEHPDGFKPSTDLDEFYGTPDRHAEITVCSNTLHTVSPYFLGINTSYFNDTDEIWDTYSIREKLTTAGVRAMRYPGGEETSFFHWEHPGVNGYEDLFDDPRQHGYAPKRGPFQMTWVDPSKWATNEAFMNFDEFMAHCRAIGAEPVVGINLSFGAKHGRESEGVEEALRWMRYCKEENYKVTYWFLDNEPWHHEAAHQMYVKPYATECVRYGKAIKAEFPDVKLIANPFSSETYNAWGEVEHFVSTAGDYVDYIDIHYYWEWGRSSFQQWQNTTPLETGDRWKRQSVIRTYREDFRLLREAFEKAGHPDMGLMVLEWNIAPSPESLVFSQALTALIQSELLMEFMRGDVHMTCLWPLLWRTSRDVWAEQDPFSSIITQDAPYNPTLSADLFRMLSPVQGMELVKSCASTNDIVVLAARSEECTKLLVLSKNDLRRKITVSLKSPHKGLAATIETISVRNQVTVKKNLAPVTGSELVFFAEPLSFNLITLTGKKP